MANPARSLARRSEVEVSRLAEVAEFARHLSMLFKELGIPQRQYAARVIMDETVVSRYLNGKRVATQDFLDRLIKEVDRHRKANMQEAAVAHLKRLRLSALSVVDPEAFEMEQLREQIDVSHREIRRLLRHQEALIDLLEKRESQAEKAEQKFAELEADWITERLEVRSTEIQLRSDRDRLNDECGRLRDEILSLRGQLESVRNLRTESEERCKRLENELEAAELALAEKQAAILEESIEVLSLEDLKEEVTRARQESRLSEVAQKLVLASGRYSIEDLLSLASWLRLTKQNALCGMVLSDAARFRPADFLLDLIESVEGSTTLGMNFALPIASSIGTLRSQDEVLLLHSRLWMKPKLFRAVQEMISTWILSVSPDVAAEFISSARSLGDSRLVASLLFDVGASTAQFASGVARALIDSSPDDALVIVTRNIRHNPSSTGPGELFVRFARDLDPTSPRDVRLFRMAASQATSAQARNALGQLYPVWEFHQRWNLFQFFERNKQWDNLLENARIRYELGRT
ncbi:hypothetical protein [Kitasatospora sp. MBT63]|uniref:hypothetical protein n=1 Tax=Kitasatospora sp. MBT63 TaxID=1444768 RepID=UPI0011EA7046|nr:hypothetical protein [Kitasatospora sp. MBT63]